MQGFGTSVTIGDAIVIKSGTLFIPGMKSGRLLADAGDRSGPLTVMTVQHEGEDLFSILFEFHIEAGLRSNAGWKIEPENEKTIRVVFTNAGLTSVPISSAEFLKVAEGDNGQTFLLAFSVTTASLLGANLSYTLAYVKGDKDGCQG